MLDDPQPELNNNSFPKIALVLALAVGVILVVILIFFIINFFRPQSATNTNIPTPTPVRTVDSLPQDQRVSTLQKSVINKTTQDEIESAQEYESKTTQPDGSTVYYFKSPYDARKAEVIVRNNVVVFERIMTPVSSKDPGYARISDFTKRFDQPQTTLRGSVFYGPFISALIYADKGITVVGNTMTDEVFEIQLYPPTTVEEYRLQYGQDIDESLDDNVL